MRTFAACDVGRRRDVSLDAVTGGVVWEQPVADPTTGYYITMAPLTVDGKVMVGMSGGGYGIRGFVIALDVDTGREVWKTHTVTAPAISASSRRGISTPASRHGAGSSSRTTWGRS